jgi:hypothetical protein
MNLSTRNGRRILLDTGRKFVEVFAIAILHVNIKTGVPIYLKVLYSTGCIMRMTNK